MKSNPPNANSVPQREGSNKEPQMTDKEGKTELTEEDLRRVAGGLTPGGWNRVKNVVESS
jgi:hypothetical protein